MHMERNEFVYQRATLKEILLFGILILLTPGLDYLICKVIGISDKSILHFIFYIVLASAALYPLRILLNQLKCFVCKGSYWISNGVVYIQKGNKPFSLVNIEKVRARVLSDRKAKYGKLTIETEKRIHVFQSLPKASVEKFSDCDLAPLLESILSCNPQLAKDEDWDAWDVWKADDDEESF